MKIYIGWDSLQEDASMVCEYSIHKHAKYDIDIKHLKLEELEDQNLYWRETASASTEFSYSRFLVPYLQDYNGWAIFVDSDFVFLRDIHEIYEQLKYTPNADDYSCFVVKHADYIPKQEVKFYGKKQEALPMKNWTSFILFNCEHPDVKRLNPLTINNHSPRWLHRFEWTRPERVGMLDVRWNWLVGEYGICDDPWALHYTNGGPFNNEWGQDYEDVWLQYFKEHTGLDYKKLQS